MGGVIAGAFSIIGRRNDDDNIQDIKDLPGYWASIVYDIKKILYNRGLIDRATISNVAKYLFNLRWDDVTEKWIDSRGHHIKEPKYIFDDMLSRLRDAIGEKRIHLNVEAFHYIFLKMFKLCKEESICTDDFNSIKLKYEILYKFINQKDLWYSTKLSRQDSLDARIWNIIRQRFRDFLNYPLKKSVICEKIFKNRVSRVRSGDYIALNKINRIYYLLSIIESVDVFDFMDSEHIPILNDISKDDLVLFKKTLIEDIIIEIFKSDSNLIEGHDLEERSEYLTEFYLYYYLYNTMFQEKNLKDPTVSGFNPLKRSYISKFSYRTSEKMWSRLDSNSIIKIRTAYKNIKNELESLIDQYSSARRTLWYLENVYGVNRRIITKRTSSYDLNFAVNPHFDLDLLPITLKSYIYAEMGLIGQFPFNVEDIERISSFGNKLTINGISQMGDSFNVEYLNEFIKKAGIKVTFAKDIGNLDSNVARLIDLAKRIQNHDKCVKNALTFVDGGIVIELPIFDPETEKLTGHIDLLIKESDGHLVIWDYKPQWESIKWTPSPNSYVSHSFIQFVPQIASYTLTLMHQLGLKGFMCGIFNSEGAWEFDPEIVMKTINSDFKDAHFPWEPYYFLYLMNDK